ncbi:MAG TPA: aldolase/citrate lyase family protein [Burkholderiales bacterium]|jgi:4-hydroxy-2-oxoheptanedioate aldolase|nr:aldolase/citrate lyase family protein [Burkholderiales bacterium]
MKKNRMKEKLRAGEPVYGVSVMIPSPQIVEMVAAAGFDWVLLDCEHGTLTIESVELMAMAAEASGITAIARPVTRGAEHILQVLDRGVMGVQVPHVNTAEDARQVVAAVKYHPLGQRGLAAGTRSAVYDSHGTLADYVKAANDATLIAIQLEEQAAIDNIDQLLKVDDIDVYFIGPSDLSQSMGHPGNPRAPAVAAAIDGSFRKMVAAGRTPGTPATAENVREVLDKGVRYIYTHLPRLLSGSAKAYLKAARG